MRVGVLNHYESLSTKNYCFNTPNAPIGDDLLLPFVRLAEEGKRRGHELLTLDMAPLDSFDALLFVDTPARRLFDHPKKYLLTYECPVILPQNWRHHEFYEKVFTWSDAHVGTSPRYVKMNFATSLQPLEWKIAKSGFACLVASNKFSAHKNELYSEREKVIAWFERNAAGSLTLFGPGWNRLTRPSYRGVLHAGSKRAVLSHFKFNICYENAQGYPGYITEKIFDAFLAGCVPVYLGAPNVLDHIPSGTFIDRRRFATEEDLFHYMRTMSDAQYEEYRTVIRAFLKSEAARPFSIETFVDTILSGIAK